MSDKQTHEFQRFDTVMHKRTGQFYIIQGFPKVRTVDETWVPGVLYAVLDDHEDQFVRTLDAFLPAFKRIGGLRDG